MILTGLVICFIIQSVLSYGLFFGYVQNKFKTIAKEQYLDNMGNSMLFGIIYSLLPVIGFGVVILSTEFGRFGFKFK